MFSFVMMELLTSRGAFNETSTLATTTEISYTTDHTKHIAPDLAGTGAAIGVK